MEAKKKPVCKFGTSCTRADCSFVHPDGKNSSTSAVCKFGTSCTRADCSFVHPDGKNSSTSAVCKFGTSCTRADCSFVHPDGKNSSKSAICKFGTSCTRADCSFVHPDGKSSSNSAVCKFGTSCTRADCSFVHPDGKKAQISLSSSSVVCKFGASCTHEDCSFVHHDRKQTQIHLPDSSLAICKFGTDCTHVNCTFVHPDGKKASILSPDNLDCSIHHLDTHTSCNSDDLQCTLDDYPLCRYADSCFSYNCVYRHSSKRKACSAGRECLDFDCTLIHPPTREKLVCKFKTKCFKIDCAKHHPPGHKVCPLLEVCFDVMCTLTHPPTRPKICPQKMNCQNTDCEHLHPPEWDPSTITAKETHYLKTTKTRQSERINTSLPILKSQRMFLDQLKKDRVVVVTAETGSGKTTQLPQYCAEEFSGLIVCTQPRAIAAISIAQRIAQEFDGTAAGNNVGYSVGGGNCVHGQRIVLMTDASLVRMAQIDANLKHVSVLVIDEAHERSLNTDLVLGIARLVTEKRKDDFYVVIASATIDPKPFLEFFFGKITVYQPLNVPGRTFPVDIEYANDIDDDDDLLKSGYLISKVIESLEKHNEGHCLVFLPGSNEVDDALRQFTKEACTEWVGLPLYGSLPPEEQSKVLNFDDCDGTLRMVVFCTNIAETSLTVPNVRVVIDTGLAKEARYDPKRRMTVLELVYISRSSAEQRKGRAGRTAPGHCIRLYNCEWLTRDHITPEILRSSLDLVVLQLCKIGYNPQTFPFIDPPNSDLIALSLKTLQNFDCLDKTYKITERGNIFNELPFDPRLSHFVVSAHEQYGNGEMASNIAAILSAPGSIFFMGGGKTGRDEVKKRIADESAKYDSDLLYLQSIYHSWFEAGKVDQASLTCNSCAKKIPSCLVKRNHGCRPCRTRHSTKYGLNNKIVEIILKNVVSVMSILKNKRRQGICYELDPVEAIGRCLLGGFEDQLGLMILPNNPKAGAYLLSSATKAHLSNSTSLAVARGKIGAPHFFVSMLVTQIPNGMTIADHAHPIKEDWLTQSQLEKISKHSLQMSLCYSHDNLNKRFLKHVQKQITSIPIRNGLERFITCYYDSDRNAICVFAPQEIYSDVNCYVSKIIDAKLKEEREFEQVVLIGEGSANATFIGGLHIHSLEQIGLALRVTYPNPPVKSTNELKTWILKETKISEQMIKWHHYYPEQKKEGAKYKEAYAIAVFRDETSAEKASKINNEQGIIESHRSSTGYGQELLLSVLLDEHTVRNKLEPLLPKPIHIRTVKPQTFTLRVRNIPLNDLLHVSKYLQPSNMELKNPDIQVHRDEVFINLPSAASHDAYLLAERNLLQSPLGTTHFQKMITTKKGHQKCITVKLETKIIPSHVILSLLFAKTEDAEQFVINNSHALSECKLYAEALVYINHPELYDIEFLASSVAKKYSVTYTVLKTKNAIKFTGSSPQQVGLGAQALQAYICPLKIHLSDRKQQVLLSELNSSKRILHDASVCGVSVECHESEAGEVFRLTIHGPQINQGQFMNTIGEHSTEFDGRYECIHYDPITASIFQIPSAGSKRLQSLQGQITGARLKFLKHLDSIEIVVDPNVHESKRENILKSCKEGITKIVTELCGDRKVVDQTCVKCKADEGRQLYICGHYCCKKCRNTLCEEYIKKPTTIGICCPICSELMSVKDIRDSQVFNEACITSAKQFLKNNAKHALTFCPQKNCMALLLREMDYEQCKICQSYVCVKCRTVDNQLHLGKNCSDFKMAVKLEKQGSCFEILFSSAKAFVKSNWSPVLGEPQYMDENPGIKLGCPAMIRYCNALEESSILNGSVLPKTFFAWHGTSSDEAIKSICHNGFDPQRRCGQAYGTGEYFGYTSEISHGYAGGTSRLIVAQLLQVPQTTTHGNFCYVVNNPTDWKKSFSLPVLVVTYGKTLCPLSFVTNYPPQRIPLNLFGSRDIPEEEGQCESHDCVQSEVSIYDWMSPYRWHWQNDGGILQPYPDSINGLIEEAFSAYQSGSGTPEYTTPSIVRFVDDKPQCYKINFEHMIQINMKSQYTRQVSRMKVMIQTTMGSTWQFFDGVVWVTYDSLTQGQIELAFRGYVDKCGSSKLLLQFPGRPEPYELCFAQGKQINKQTGAVRNIRRV